jgi:16S rRNA (guanine1207-N2)-methyltransferase
MAQKKHRSPKKSKPAAKPKSGLPRGIADRLILDQCDRISAGNALLVLMTGTALAKHLTTRRPDVRWNIFTCEHFYLTAIINALSDDADDNVDREPSVQGEIELFCTPDPPDGEFDTIVFPTDFKGSSELTRELLQSIALQLKPTGQLIISTNNPRDHWLHQLLKDTFGRTTVIKDKQGICYVARKGTSIQKQKMFGCEFAFRDGERLIRCYSRPGVFSHRRMDAGARALIRSLDLLKDDPRFVAKPPRRIIEMGCGSGTVSTAVALRYPAAQIIAVDSHARAVESTFRTATLNDVTNVATLLTSDGGIPDPGTHDLFLCNPPYYSDFRISELFLEAAVEALRPGGKIHLVTKLTDWHQNRMIEIFANATIHQIGEYDVIVSRR